jgi:N-dimethylarginine dimethylaminohydrolase
MGVEEQKSIDTGTELLHDLSCQPDPEERRFEFGYTNEYDKLQSVMIHIPRRNELEYHDAKKAMYKSIPNYEKLLEEVDAYRSKLIELGIHVCDDLYFHETEYNPFPNQLYMRDLAVITPDSVMLANPKYDIRKGEEQNLLATLRHWGFEGRVIELSKNATMEGADFFWISKNEVLISVGNRTNEEFVTSFKFFYPNIKVTTVAAAAEGIPQHILGGAHIVDKDTIIQRRSIVKHDLGFKNVISLEETDEVVNGYAMNIVTIGPMEIIMPEGNPETQKIYESHGIKVHTSPAYEMGKMGGCFACATLPIKRG